MPNATIQSYLNDQTMPLEKRQAIINAIDAGQDEEQIADMIKKKYGMRYAPAPVRTNEFASWLDAWAEQNGLNKIAEPINKAIKPVADVVNPIGQTATDITNATLNYNPAAPGLDTTTNPVVEKPANIIGKAVRGTVEGVEKYAGGVKDVGEALRPDTDAPAEERAIQAGEGMIDIAGGVWQGALAVPGAVISEVPYASDIVKPLVDVVNGVGQWGSDQFKAMLKNSGVELTKEQEALIDKGAIQLAQLEAAKLAKDVAKVTKYDRMMEIAQRNARINPTGLVPGAQTPVTNLQLYEAMAAQYGELPLTGRIGAPIAETISEFARTAAAGAKSIDDFVNNAVRIRQGELGSSLQKAGEGLFRKFSPPRVVEAGKLQAEAVGTGRPVHSTAESVLESKNVGGFTKRQLGDSALKEANRLWKEDVQPALKTNPTKINLKDRFAELEKMIKKEAEPGRRAELKAGLDALKEDYKTYSRIGLEKAQDIKSGLDQFTPQKMWKGQDVASGYNQMKHEFADLLRRDIHDAVGPEVGEKYYDYGNLRQLGEGGVTARTQAAIMGGSGRALGDFIRAAGLPVGVYGGKMLYWIGDRLHSLTENKDGSLTIKPATDIPPAFVADIMKNYNPEPMPTGERSMGYGEGPGAALNKGKTIPREATQAEAGNINAPILNLEGGSQKGISEAELNPVDTFQEFVRGFKEVHPKATQDQVQQAWDLFHKK